jgi:hypothetical protein
MFTRFLNRTGVRPGKISIRQKIVPELMPVILARLRWKAFAKTSADIRPASKTKTSR